MAPSFYHIDQLDISNNLDFPRELLNSPSYSENSILVVGPDLVKREAVYSYGHGSTYLGCLFEGMVEWCIQEKVIQGQDIVHDLHTLLHNDALVPLGYRIEEYLAIQQQKEQCLRAVLYRHNQVRKIHYDLTHIPFRGYITTNYDTCIETAYAETQHRHLCKFYKPSLSQAVDACRKKQPFILKLYGDLDDVDSIKLGHRSLTGLYAEDVREQLQQLFSEAPAIFIGFDDTDGDLTVLRSFVKEGSIVYQRHPKRVPEKVERDDLLKRSDYEESTPISKTFSHDEMLLTVRNPPRDTKEASRRTSPATFSSPDTGQDSQKVITVCIFYAPKDKKYKDGIEEVLRALNNKIGQIFVIDYKSWAMGESLGYTTDIKNPLMSKQLIILLISTSFLGSPHYDKEQMQKVVKRHQKRAWISPILVRSCDWRGTQFDSLEEYILPRNKIPIADWRPQDKAYLDISRNLAKAFDYLACC